MNRDGFMELCVTDPALAVAIVFATVAFVVGGVGLIAGRWGR